MSQLIGVPSLLLLSSALALSSSGLASTTMKWIDTVNTNATNIVIWNWTLQSNNIGISDWEHAFKQVGAKTFTINPDGTLIYIKPEEEEEEE